jgi:WS/DGAT/MGAT family acyltransferase
MSNLSPLELSFFAMESNSRPMHAGGLMLFDSPPDGDTAALISTVMKSFRTTEPVTPWNRRPAFGLRSLPHWVTVDEVDLTYHVRRVTVSAPGSFQQLMELVTHLYPALLDRSRPLWETYVIDGLEGGQVAVFVKAHHSLADGVGGLKMFYGSLSVSPDDDPRPVWGPAPVRSRRSKKPKPAGKPQVSGIGRLLKVPGALAQVVPDVVNLARQGTAPPFRAAKMPAMAAQISSARSFAAFDLPLPEVKAIGKAFAGTVNDVVLSICDDAMRRYTDKAGGSDGRPMIALLPVSTRREGETASNAAGATLVRLGESSASPDERLKQIVAATTRAKAAMRNASPIAIQLQALSMLGCMELREQLPVARGWVPNVANFTLSNVPGAPPTELYLGRAQMTGMYATPIVSGSNAANFTLIPYLDTLCVGIGAARNVIPDTARLAELAVLAFEDLKSYSLANTE